jgi:hypothetical protein
MSDASLEYIRNYYRRPANKGQRITYTGAGKRESGVIVGARNAYLLVEMDGERGSVLFHPTWELEYEEQTHE